MAEEVILDIQHLSVSFRTAEGQMRAVRDVSFTVKPGESLGIVGESGSGKSVSALSVMGLIPTPPGHIDAGKIMFEKENLLEKNAHQMNRIRGNKIAMIFQEPMTSLNPIHTCGKQIMEPMLVHQHMNLEDALRRALDLMTLVGIPMPQKRLKEYPHQLSGGMRQRVMIAMALACNPLLLIADEPTTALDVTIQAQILEIINKLRREVNSAIIMITHDLGVIAEVCERVIVMYNGQIVEAATFERLFKNPFHPYAEGLLLSIPHISRKKVKLFSIEGMVPNPFEKLEGCSFAPRCNYAQPLCRQQEPELREVQPGRHVRCHFYLKDQQG